MVRFEDSGEPKITEKDLKEFEDLIGKKLPEDYKKTYARIQWRLSRCR